MPHVPDVTATSHDRHDPMLVAALAAGDLAGTERDQAIALTRSCAECASLHADLVAIATATTTLPPPIPAPNRDFRLTPAQAESLRRTGWRRLLPGGSVRGSLTRPLGVALATLGIVGLLIGSQPLGFASSGSAGAAPEAATSGANRDVVAGSGSTSGAGASNRLEAAVPAASAAAASAAPPAPAAAASSGPVLAPVASAGSDAQGGGFGSESPGDVGIAGNPAPAASAEAPAKSSGALESTTDASTTPASSWSPLAIVSVVALVLGIVLLIVARRRENPSA